ncbi:MAG: YqgE/AlgH family protein, partial [Burkholderiaceae bacterium]
MSKTNTSSGTSSSNTAAHTLNLAGQFLIAMPNLSGDTFERTVVYICEHSSNGALGLIVNRTADVKVSEILNKLATEDSDIRYTHS